MRSRSLGRAELSSMAIQNRTCGVENVFVSSSLHFPIVSRTEVIVIGAQSATSDYRIALPPLTKRQVADEKNSVGSVRLFFESDIAANTEKFIRDEDFGLVYISKKKRSFRYYGDVAGDKWF